MSKTKKLQLLGQLGDKIYTQNEAPTDAEEGALWVDMDADGSVGSGGSAVLYTAQNLTEEQKAQVRENIGATSIYLNPPSTHIPSVPNGTIVDNCQDLSKWALILGTKEADTSDFLIGTQCIRFNRRIQINNIDVPIENKQFRIKFKVNDWGDATVLQLYVTDNNFTTFDYAVVVNKSDSHSFVKVGEWVDVVVPLPTFRNNVINSLTNVTTIRLTTDNDNCSISLQQISMIDAPTPKSIVSFAFDDGYDNNFTKAAPILAEFGIPATTYIIPRTIAANRAGNLSEEQVLKLKQMYGWDIECHLSQNMGDLSEDEMAEEISYAKRWIQERGLGTGNHFAYPDGYYDATVEKVCRKYFATARTIDAAGVSGFNSLHSPNPYRLRAVSSVGNSTGGFSVSNVKALIDRLAYGGGWLILVFHHIDDENTSSGMYCSSAALREIAQYAVDSDVEIRTVADAVEGKSAYCSIPRAEEATF